MVISNFYEIPKPFVDKLNMKYNLFQYDHLLKLGNSLKVHSIKILSIKHFQHV